MVKKEEFDKDKEIGYILKWLVIISIISGILWQILGLPIKDIVYLTIIVILLIINYIQYKKIILLEKKNGKKKKK